MDWDYTKPTEEKSRVEIELTDIFDYLRSIETKLKKIDAVAGSLYLKAKANHGEIEKVAISRDQIQD